MLLGEVAAASADVAATSSRLEKVARLSSVLADLEPAEVPIAVAYLSGVLPQGSIGVGWASLKDLPPAAPAPATLELLDVDAALSRIGALAGAGSQTARRTALHDLFARATDDEQDFLRGLLMGEIRQGALEGVMVEAISRAANVPRTEVRRAAMLTGDLGATATAAIEGGSAALAGFRLSLLTPLQPMLAQSADDVPSALARISPAALEWKLDGARIQVHRLGDEVRAFTRNLADVTDRVPEIVADDPEPAPRGRGVRRGGDRAATRPAAASLRSDDEPVREPEPEGPHGVPDGLPALRVRLRRAAPRWRGPDRPPRRRAVRRPGRTAARRAPRSSDRHGGRREGRPLPG